MDKVNNKFIKACENGNIDTVKVSIDLIDNIDIQDKFGNTALIRASVYGHKGKEDCSQSSFVFVRRINHNSSLQRCCGSNKRIH